MRRPAREHIPLSREAVPSEPHVRVVRRHRLCRCPRPAVGIVGDHVRVRPPHGVERHNAILFRREIPHRLPRLVNRRTRRTCRPTHESVAHSREIILREPYIHVVRRRRLRYHPRPAVGVVGDRVRVHPPVRAYRQRSRRRCRDPRGCPARKGVTRHSSWIRERERRAHLVGRWVRVRRTLQAHVGDGETPPPDNLIHPAAVGTTRRQTIFTIRPHDRVRAISHYLNRLLCPVPFAGDVRDLRPVHGDGEFAVVLFRRDLPPEREHHGPGNRRRQA